MKSLLLLVFSALSLAQDQPSEECSKALTVCEEDIDCNNRLGPLAAACSTGTCQPQCRSAVMNLYQNKLGRVLFKTDGSCVPGREELKTCNFLPSGNTLHCGIAKLACEGDLQCTSKYQVFLSECEAETARQQCSDKCRTLFKQVTSTQYGKAFGTCTCTEKEDHLCAKLREELMPCIREPLPTPPPELPTTRSSNTANHPKNTNVEEPDSSANLSLIPALMLCALLTYRALFAY